MNKIFAFIIFLSISSCNDFNIHKPVYVISAEQRISTRKHYSIRGLYSHISQYAKESTHGSTYSPPPYDTIDCNYVNQNIVAIIIGSKTDYYDDFKKVVPDSIIYSTNYFSDSNFIIDIPELKRSLFPVEKCNKYYRGKMPVPYFENYDFALGEKTVLKKQLKGEPRSRRHTVYVVPEDLKVYVIAARAGNFWKFDCNETRPETLGKWKHGYSKGVAISDKTNKVVFWVIVW